MNRQQRISDQYEFDGQTIELLKQPPIIAPIPPYKSPFIPDDAQIWGVQIGFKDGDCNGPTKWLMCWTPPGTHIFDLLDQIEDKTIQPNEEVYEYFYLSPEIIAEHDVEFHINKDGWMLQSYRSTGASR